MITQVIKLLQTDDWYNVSNEVEIAKGRYQRITKFRHFKTQVKRMIKSKNFYK